jgi:ADP-ribose pyrophosphatase
VSNLIANCQLTATEDTNKDAKLENFIPPHYFGLQQILSVEAHTVELPDGRVIEDWPWVVTPDFVNVVAVTEAGEFLLFRQTKYSIPGLTLATVGGYLEPGEEPLAAAQRELREETGYAAA